METTNSQTKNLLVGAAATVTVAACFFVTSHFASSSPSPSSPSPSPSPSPSSSSSSTPKRSARLGALTTKKKARKAIDKRTVGGVPNIVFISILCVEEEEEEEGKKGEKGEKGEKKQVDELCVVELSAESAHVVFSLSCHLTHNNNNSDNNNNRVDFSSISSLLSTTLNNKFWILCDKRDTTPSSSPSPSPSPSHSPSSLPTIQLLQSLFLSPSSPSSPSSLSSPPSPQGAVCFEELRRRGLGVREGERLGGEKGEKVAQGSPVGYGGGGVGGRVGPSFDVCHSAVEEFKNVCLFSLFEENYEFYHLPVINTSEAPSSSSSSSPASSSPSPSPSTPTPTPTPTPSSSSSPPSSPAPVIVSIEGLSPSKSSVYVMYTEEKLSLEEIAEKRKIKRSTVCGYLADALALGLPLDYTKLGVTEENVKEVEEAAKKAGGFGLKPLKESLPSSYTYDLIKFCVAVLKGKMRESEKDSKEKEE